MRGHFAGSLMPVLMVKLTDLGADDDNGADDDDDGDGGDDDDDDG